MSIYAISDLHLSFGAPEKAMDVFGTGWFGYMDKIEREWRAIIKDGDYVLLPGDFSWATYINDAKGDFSFLEGLPGKKVLSKGNHDYWWTTMSKMNEFLFKNGFKTIEFLHNNSMILPGGVGVTAARGWMRPDTAGFNELDEKIYRRELIRLRLSFESLAQLRLVDKNGNKTMEEFGDHNNDGIVTDGCGTLGCGKVILMLHYPPVIRGSGFADAYKGDIDARKSDFNDFSDIIEEYKPDVCLYGHMHGDKASAAFEGTASGTAYRLVSADYLGFKPALIL